MTKNLSFCDKCIFLRLHYGSYPHLKAALRSFGKVLPFVPILPVYRFWDKIFNLQYLIYVWSMLFNSSQECLYILGVTCFPEEVTRASSQNSFLNKISQIFRPPNLGEDTLPGRLLSFLPPSNPCLFNAFDVRGSNRNSPDQIFSFFSKYFLFFPVSKYLPLFPSLLFSFSR